MGKRIGKALWIMLLAISIFFITSFHGAPARADKGMRVAYVPGRVVVKFKQGVKAAQVAQLHASQGATVVGEIPRLGVQILSVPAGEEETKVAAYRGNAMVE